MEIAVHVIWIPNRATLHLKSQTCLHQLCLAIPLEAQRPALLSRIAIAFLLMAPLGLALGVFMPLGVRTIATLSEHQREYVAWSWALNGFASVVGSVLATILAMTYGFHVVLLVALGAYIVAFLALHGLSRRAVGAPT